MKDPVPSLSTQLAVTSDQGGPERCGNRLEKSEKIINIDLSRVTDTDHAMDKPHQKAGRPGPVI